MDFEKLFIGAFGAVIGVIGWLFVGLYIQRRAKDRAAREAARVVYFEIAANHLNVYTALAYGAFGPLTRTSFDRLLPELAAWLPIEELQSVSLAYMSQAGYDQAANAVDIPVEVKRRSLLSIHDAHRTAVRQLRARAFTTDEIERLTEALRPDQLSLMNAADEGSRLADPADRAQATTHA